jgi:hypothetical protein
MGPRKRPFLCIITILGVINLPIDAYILDMFQAVCPYLGPMFCQSQFRGSTEMLRTGMFALFGVEWAPGKAHWALRAQHRIGPTGLWAFRAGAEV